jgi:superfamily II DNA or RNA helicase
VPPELADEFRVASSVIAKPNPERRSWERRKRAGGFVGDEPPEKYVCAGAIPDGQHAGHYWLPRHAPVACRQLSDGTTLPLGETLKLRTTLRPYQTAALDAWSFEQSGTIVAPCGAGKTTLGAGAIAAVSTPALVLVHTLALADQWAQRCMDQLGVTPGRIGGGVQWLGAPDAFPRVVVATVQTLAQWSWSERWDFGSRFGLVVLDEAHHVPARTFAETFASLPARYRLGLTATPTRQDGLEDLLWWSCGPAVYRIAQKDLEDGGFTLRPKVTWVQTAFKPTVSSEEWTKLTDELAQDAARNELVSATAAQRLTEGRSVLVLADRTAHCAALAEQISAWGQPAEALTGSLSKKARGDVLERLTDGRLRCAVATSLADEGLDVPGLDVVVLAAPSRNDGRVQQRVGRALRPHASKAQPEVVDFVDPFPMARNAAKSRHRLYRNLGWGPPPVPGAGA